MDGEIPRPFGVILKPKDYQRWLDEGEETQPAGSFLRSYPEEDMKSWRVSDKVGNSKQLGGAD